MSLKQDVLLDKTSLSALAWAPGEYGMEWKEKSLDELD